jgi:hypothetical protein
MLFSINFTTNSTAMHPYNMHGAGSTCTPVLNLMHLMNGHPCSGCVVSYAAPAGVIWTTRVPEMHW